MIRNIYDEQMSKKIRTFFLNQGNQVLEPLLNLKEIELLQILIFSIQISSRYNFYFIRNLTILTSSITNLIELLCHMYVRAYYVCEKCLEVQNVEDAGLPLSNLATLTPEVKDGVSYRS